MGGRRARSVLHGGSKEPNFRSLIFLSLARRNFFVLAAALDPESVSETVVNVAPSRATPRMKRPLRSFMKEFEFKYSV
jgi:hypothetical protein